MGKKGRPAKGAKGMMIMGKMGKSAKRALLGMSKKEREMVVAGLSNGNTSNWSAKKMREAMEPKGKKKAELAAAVPANHQTAKAYFCKPNQVGLLFSPQGSDRCPLTCALDRPAAHPACGRGQL